MTNLPLARTSAGWVYTGRVTNWPMVAATSVAAIPLIMMPALGSGPAWAIAIPIGLAAVGVLANLLTASSVRTTAGPNGVTVHWGPIGWPRSHYALVEIAAADVVDVPSRRVSWGFWWTPRRTCNTVRSGPNLRLTLRNARTVTITVPDPNAAVAALHDARTAQPG